MFLSFKKKQKFLLYLTSRFLLFFEGHALLEILFKKHEMCYSKFKFKHLLNWKRDCAQSNLFSHFTRLMVSTINPKAYGTKKAANSNFEMWPSAL